MNKNYYELLGLSQNASKDEIKREYFRLAKKYHPDLNKEKDAEKKFKEITEAYQTLFDDNSRREYDKFLRTSSSFNSSSSNSTTSHKTFYEKKYFDSSWIERYLNSNVIDIYQFEQRLNSLSIVNKYYTYEYFFLAFWAGSNITLNLIKNKMCLKIFEVFERSIDKRFIISMSKSFAATELGEYEKMVNSLCFAISQKSVHALNLIIDVIDDENIFDNSNTAMISLIKFNSTKNLIRLIDQNINLKAKQENNKVKVVKNGNDGKIRKYIEKIKSNEAIKPLIYVLVIVGFVFLLSLFLYLL